MLLFIGACDPELESCMVCGNSNSSRPVRNCSLWVFNFLQAWAHVLWQARPAHARAKFYLCAPLLGPCSMVALWACSFMQALVNVLGRGPPDMRRLQLWSCFR